MCVSCLYIRLVPRDAQRECCTLASKYSSLNKVVVDAELADENPALLAQIALMLKRDADLNLIELQWVVQSLNKGRLLPVDDFKYTPKRKAGLTRALEDASAVEHVLVAAEEVSATVQRLAYQRSMCRRIEPLLMAALGRCIVSPLVRRYRGIAS
eukprot:21036-Heterococcus_DN1.PRE.1